MSRQSSLSSSSSGIQKMHVTEGTPSTSTEGKTEARKKGMGWGMASFFFLTEMAASGFLALPKALADTGWLGVVMMLVFCWGVGFSSIKLGESWVILEERWPDLYAGGSRRPFLDIAEKSLGRIGRIVTTVIFLIGMLGAAIIFIILLGAFMHELVDSLSVCAWVLIVGTALTPFTWFGTPVDFWHVSIISVVSTVLACLIIFIELMLEIPDDFPPEYRNPTISTFLLGFATILYGFAGSPVFPTIQNDMADRSLINRSLVVAFTGLLMLYLPVALGGYVVKGSDVEGNILLGVDTDKWWIQVAIVLEIVNLVGTFMIGSNPVCQLFESVVGVEDKFAWRRILARSFMMMSLVLVAIAVPNFNQMLNLVGGSAIPIGSFCLPGIMYLRLCDMKGDWERKEVQLWERTALILIVGVGAVLGVLSTVLAIMDILDLESLSQSCFVNFSG